MLQDYLPIVVLVTISTALAAVIILLGHLLGPHQPTKRKLEPYESGMRPIGPAMRRMPVRFYLVAVLFILFDIEVVFFLPWAVTLQTFIHNGLGMFAFIEMLVFIVILLVGYVWLWQKGALEWE
jgi:NADH-quinone oxidoreductase subunit A